jgi:hypothetical protein
MRERAKKAQRQNQMDEKPDRPKCIGGNDVTHRPNSSPLASFGEA